MSTIYQILMTKKVRQIRFKNIHSVKTFLKLCEKTNDVLWAGGQRPLYEMRNIESRMRSLSEEYAVASTDLDIHWYYDNTLRFTYGFGCYDRLCEYERGFRSDTMIDGDVLLKSLGASIIILNKEDEK